MLRYKALIIFFGLLMTCCKKKQEKFDFQADYFPMIEGKFVIYNVTDIQYAQGIPNDTSRYFIRTEIGQEFIDNEGRKAFRFNRFKTSSLSEAFTQIDIWTAYLNGNKVELIEENDRKIKLVLAPSLNKEWNSNAYNTLEEEQVYYEEIGKKKTIGTLTYDESLVVVQEETNNFINIVDKREIYARGIGMVSKTMKDVTIYGGNPSNIKNGRFLQMTAVAFGG